MTINDKIKQILLTKGFSPSHFADEIGVQRSSISHILSGRNRPSFDIIQKIIKRFPDLGFDWILEDDQPSTAFHRTSLSNDRRSNENFTNQNGLLDLSDRNTSSSLRVNRTEVNTSRHQQQTDTSLDTIINEGRKVERILIFYTDGTFQEFNPIK